MKIQNISMRTNKAGRVVFSGKIIDAHAHVGIFADGLNNTCDKFEASHFNRITANPVNDGHDTVEKILVSNLNCIDNVSPDMEGKLTEKGLQKTFLNEIDGNREILNITKSNPILKPLAVCQPDKTQNADNIRTILKEGQFYGLKFHPLHMKLAANDTKYDDYMKVAEQNNLPCLFHCDAAGCKYSSPEQIYELAKRHPKVPVILAHLGAGEDPHSRAVKVLLDSINKGDATIYADISWVDCNSSDKKVITDTLKKLQHTEKGDMTSRLLFGTDAPIGRFGAEGLYDQNYYSENIKQIKNSIKNEFGQEGEKISNKLFYDNAQELFFIQKLSQKTKKEFKTKHGIIIAAVLLAAAVLANALYKGLKKKPDEKNASLVK